ncbi:unnamed protein product [Diatraea saccharalis]|uniref:C2H2-type domain-containing protein n=1 Tax=Diatraea saccharalis TaxID=40085 RepID=A0A9N9R6P9_9NEOP|nr:unnamed protein product [Diatraea saccharalis]
MSGQAIRRVNVVPHPKVEVKKPKPQKKAKLVKVNESLQPEQILSAMTPGSLTSLASEDVSYIIIKSEDEIGDVKKRKVDKAVCGAGFNSSKELSDHTSTDHVKLKPFKCDICNKRFTQQVKPYRCVICTKSFCQSIHLKQHMRTHTNVSPFQCGVCNKRFKQSSHLNYHLRNHNPANLTDEQKKRYTELIGMIIDQAEVPDVEQMEQIETEVAEGTEVEVEINEMVDISQEEQQVAEQSIEVWETDPTYVLSEESGEKWTVKLVD